MTTLKAYCRKFSPNIFVQTKCQNCFRTREVHSADALGKAKTIEWINTCKLESNDLKLDKNRRNASLTDVNKLKASIAELQDISEQASQLTHELVCCRQELIQLRKTIKNKDQLNDNNIVKSKSYENGIDGKIKIISISDNLNNNNHNNHNHCLSNGSLSNGSSLAVVNNDKKLIVNNNCNLNNNFNNNTTTTAINNKTNNISCNGSSNHINYNNHNNHINHIINQNNIISSSSGSSSSSSSETTPTNGSQSSANQTIRQLNKDLQTIRLLNAELKEAQSNYDFLEIAYERLTKKVIEMERSHESDLNLMKDRINDLTQKLFTSEQLLKLAKQKISKYESRQERRRTSSLKGKPQPNADNNN